MNVSCCWIAVKGLDKDAVLSALGLVEGAPHVEPFSCKHQLAELPSGWLIVLSSDFNYPKPQRMAAVSAGGIALACSIDERVMYSVARGYQDGRAVWSADHNGGEKGLYHLSIAGDPPPELATIRARLTAEQDAAGGDDAEVDLMFDIPAELVECFCGYRFDPTREGPSFRALELAKPAKGGLGRALGKLFGRG